VANELVESIKNEALGDKVLKSVSPTQQFVSVVYEELVKIMGAKEAPLSLQGRPAVLMVCGLQGSGKTTLCAKLAHFLKKDKRKILLAACDLQRPAAVEQLKQLGQKIETDVFSIDGETNPTKVAKKALEKAKEDFYDLLIVDTAGRLHVDEELMDELQKVKSIVEPHEILFVANATTGQDAVNAASAFNEKISITGSVLTMLDGNARAGAALSIRQVTQKPLKFEGIGEKIEDLQVFNPESMADRILGRGDMINLVRKAKEHIDEEESEKLEKKLRKATFNYEDYLKQMRMIQKMGSVKGLLKMIPGLSALKNFDASDSQLKKLEAMILSMTIEERQEKTDLTHARRKRVAKGSGNRLEDVNRMVKSFKQMKLFMKKMPSKGAIPDMQQMKEQLGRMPWR
jgi:signal recognition particle subunit SRP54